MISIYGEIRSLIKQGKSNKEIMDKFFVTQSQVEYQRRKIKKDAIANWIFYEALRLFFIVILVNKLFTTKSIKTLKL